MLDDVKAWCRKPCKHCWPTMMANMLVQFALNMLDDVRPTCWASQKMLANIFEHVQKCWPTSSQHLHVGTVCGTSNMLINMLARMLGEQRKPCQHVGSMLANMLARFAASFKPTCWMMLGQHVR